MGRTGSSYSGGTAGSWSDDSGYAKLNSNNQSSIADWSRTTDSEFYLTGVQYEIGEQAYTFEHCGQRIKRSVIADVTIMNGGPICRR